MISECCSLKNVVVARKTVASILWRLTVAPSSHRLYNFCFKRSRNRDTIIEKKWDYIQVLLMVF